MRRTSAGGQAASLGLRAEGMIVWLAVLMLTGWAGCSPLKDKLPNFDLSRNIPWSKEKRPQGPDRLSVVWTDTILNTPGEEPKRGFGGRIMFFRGDDAKPIKISGSVSVYAYDEESDKVDSIPDRKFVFTPDQVEKHYSKSDLGHSYSFWIPWDNAGGLQKKLTLLTRFESNKYGFVVSEPALVLLPGRMPEETVPGPADTGTQYALATSGQGEEGRLVAYEQATGPSSQINFQIETHQRGLEPRQRANSQERMTSTTIQVPPGFLQDRPPGQGQPAGYGQPSGYGQPAIGGGGVSPGVQNHGVQPQGAMPGHGAAAPVSPNGLKPGAQATYPTEQARAAFRGPEAGFVPGRFRVQGGPIVRPRDGRFLSRPHPSGWPSAAAPQPAGSNPYQATTTVGVASQ